MAPLSLPVKKADRTLFLTFNLPEVDLRITKCVLDFLPAELLTAHIGCSLLRSDLHKMLVFRVEEICVRWIVRQAEPDYDGDDNGEDALDDIDPTRVSFPDAIFLGICHTPSPSSITGDTIHLQDCIRQQPAKGASKCSAHK